MRFEKHCWAEIDLDALAANYRHIRRHAGGPVCGVIKADGYGHGALAVADTLRAAGCAAGCLPTTGAKRRVSCAGSSASCAEPSFAHW